LTTLSIAGGSSEYDDLDWFIGRMQEAADAQAWLDALPVEPAA
jgi:hypothetical protein